MNTHFQESLRKTILEFAKPVHKKLRGHKVDLFLRLTGIPCLEAKLLDVGGAQGISGEFLRLYANFADVVIVNLDAQDTASWSGPRVRSIRADGRELPFRSQSFDWVFSNAVIEHVGGWEDQVRFANEIRRVSAKGYFVATPNKFFPLDAHTLLPFYQFLPTAIKRRIVPYSIGYTRQYVEINLLSSLQLQELFPEAQIATLDLLGTSLVALHSKSREIDRRRSFLSVRVGKPGKSAEDRKVAASNGPLSQVGGERASFEVLGVRVHAVQAQGVVARMEGWIRDRAGCHSIAATSMHGIVEAQRDPTFKQTLNSTDLVVPDGMPLVWLGRRAGHHLPRRVYGPDLMLAFCEQTAGRGYRHFFYGGEPGVPERLAESLERRFPAMEVCGTFSPPFRSLDQQEEQEIGAMISRAAPDVLWVGLGTPKQERWMRERRDKLNVPVLVSVGAAFDFLSGRRNQAPSWMREHGLEWLFRLLQEPRRLWRRYLVEGACFVAYLGLDSLKLKSFHAGQEPEEQSTQSTPRVGTQGARAE